MLKEFKEIILRSDLITVAAGLVMAFATFYLVQSVVAYMVTPLISVFVGDPVFEVNAFSISGSEFRYGAVIEAAITFALAAAVVWFFLGRYWHRHGGDGVSASTRECPECTSPISVVAKRCPYCTAVVQPDPA
jgi:large conductance mechanosensitive channel